MELTAQLVRRGGVSVENVVKRGRSSADAEIHVLCHAYDERRNIIFAGCSDGYIRVWRPKTEFSKEFICSLLPGHKGSVTALIFCTNHANGILISGSADRSIKIWDITITDPDKACVQTLLGHGGTITAVVMVKEKLVSGSTDGTVRIWGYDNDVSMLLYPWYSLFQKLDSFNGWVTAIAARDSDSSILYVGDASGTLHQYSFASSLDGERFLYRPTRKPKKIHALSITSITVVAQENYLITVAKDATVQVHDLLSGHGVFGVENPKKTPYTHSCWSVSGRQMYLVDESGHFQVWSIAAEKLIQSFHISNTSIRSITTTSGYGDVLVSVSSGIERYSLVQSSVLRSFNGHVGSILGLSLVQTGDIGSDGKTQVHAYTAAVDNTVRIWDTYDMACVSMIDDGDHRTAEMSCCLNPFVSPLFFTGYQDGVVKAWNLDTGHCVRNKQHDNTVSGMAVAHSAANDFLLTGSYDGQVCAWHITNKPGSVIVPEISFPRLQYEVFAVAFNPQQDAVYAAGNSDAIVGWSLETQTQTCLLRVPTECITILRVDGEVLLAASDNGCIYVFDTSIGLLLRTLKLHQQAVRDFLLLPQNGLVLSCSDDGIVLLTDYASGENVWKGEYKIPVCCLAVDAVRKRVYAGTTAGGLVNFTLPDGVCDAQTLRLDDNLSELKTVSDEAPTVASPRRANRNKISNSATVQ